MELDLKQSAVRFSNQIEETESVNDGDTLKLSISVYPNRKRKDRAALVKLSVRPEGAQKALIGEAMLDEKLGRWPVNEAHFHCLLNDTLFMTLAKGGYTFDERIW